MSAALFLSRRGHALVPAGEADEAAIGDMPLGVIHKAVLTRPRSLEQLRLYHAICHRLAGLMQAHGYEMESRETVDARLRVGTGHCFLTPLSAQMAMACGSRLAAVPGRIAFDKLDQAQMNRFMDACTRLVLAELLPRLPRSAWADEVEQMILNPTRRSEQA